MRRSIGWTRAGFVAVLWCVPTSPTLAAATEAPLPLSRLEGEIVLDGRMDDPAWQRLEPLPLTQYAPLYRGPAAQRSEIRVGYDDEALYAGGWFYDDEPDGIRVNSLYRDRWNGDDAFAIYVDAFNDNTSSKWFGVTPAAMRFDLLVSADGAVASDSWDGHWDAETTVDEKGWFVEVRIPFSTLGFQSVDGRAVMGLTLTRLVSRTGERVTFPDIDPRFTFRAPSKGRKVLVTDVRSPTPVYLTPYVLAGASRRVASDPVGPDWGYETDASRELGADLRYALSGTSTLDLTVNTDFAQVEADSPQVALDRFPLFFPEKRRFFQEGADLFDFASTGGGRLFHSRRIGLTEDRRSVPVLGGARLVGRAGAWDFGALDMQTGAFDGAPSENFGVLRLRRGVLNPHSQLGLMATSRASPGRHNVAVGTDALLRLYGDEYLTLKWAATFDDSDPAETGALDRALVNAKWQRRRERGLSFTVEGLRVGRAYRPELGFLPRADVTTVNGIGNWYFYTDRHRFLRRVYPGALAFHTFRNADGALESGTWAAWIQWDTKAGGGGWIEPKLFYDDVVAPFQVGDVTIPPGIYRFADLQVSFSMPSGARLRTSLDVRAGSFFDGTRIQAIVTPTWNVSPHLELGARYQLTRLRFADRGLADDIHVAELRIRAALDSRASASAHVQYDSTAERVDLNLRLRYNFAEGTDLWLVYDEGLLTERAARAGMPLLPLSTGRALIAKCTYTLQL